MTERRDSGDALTARGAGSGASEGVSAEAHRLTLVAHAPTTAASGLVLGDRGPLLRPAPARGRAEWAGPVCCGPEPACAATAAAWGRPAEVVAGLAGPDLGRWDGRTLTEVAEADPVGFAEWLTDPEARPHGGETLADLVDRVRHELDRSAWPGGRSVWVVTPLAARAVTVAALAAPPAVMLSLDVSYGGEVQLSHHRGRWRLQGLSRVAPR